MPIASFSGRRASRPAAAFALTLAVFAAALLPSTSIAASAAGIPSTAELAQYADQLLAKNYPSGEPGGAAIVVRDGQVVLRKAYGLANVELGVPLTPESVFELGSVTKQFTAVAILMLAEQGKVRLDDEITKYLADFPTHGQKVTIEQLLTHTAGIANYTDLAEWIPRVREEMPVATLIGLFKDKPLDFPPGTKWSYSNSGYVLLGAVIEKASGKSYERFVEDEIFQKLGMKASRYGNQAEVIPNRAYGYDKADGGYRNAEYLSMTQPYAAGSLMSTLDDLAIWDRALAGETLLKRSSIERLFVPAQLASGTNTHYALGWGVSDLHGRQVQAHGGGIFGFVTMVVRVPEDKLFVAVLSNSPGAAKPPEALATAITAKAIGHAFEDRKGVQLPDSDLREYVGVYKFDDEAKRVVTYDEGKLFSRRAGGEKREISASAKDAFFFAEGGAEIRFLRGQDGKVTGALFSPGLGPESEGKKTEEPLPGERAEVKVDPALFDAFLGTYNLFPGFDLVITREGDRLFAQATGQGKLELHPAGETTYFLREVEAEISFVRGADGKVDGLVLDQGGRKNPGKRVVK
jgi:CubicO group peptidase (beta-lactamase class C family)